MENWRGFLAEAPEQVAILQYIKDNNMQLTEQQIQEGMPRWLRGMVAAGMLITTAAGVLAPNPAMADEWEDMFDQSASEQQVEAPDSAESSEVGSSTAQKIFDMITDQVPEGSTINLSTETLPSADLDGNAFGNSVMDGLQDLLANKNIEVLDKSTAGHPSNDAKGGIHISIMDHTASGEYTLQLGGTGALKNINSMSQIK